MAAGNKTEQNGPIDLVVLLWGARRTILLVTGLAIVAGIIAAYVITPRYKSEVVLFPSITNSASRALLGGMMTGRDDILALGDEKDAEQLLQVINSDEVRQRTRDRFDLMRVYGVDPNGAHPQAEFEEVFKDLVRSEYTKYGSVRVEVMDVDPQRAADIANFVSEQVDSVWSRMERTRGEEGARLVQQKLLEVEAIVAQLNDTLSRLRELGVQDYRSQSERYNQALSQAILKGDDRAVRELEERLAVLAKYGGPYQVAQLKLENEMYRLMDLQGKAAQARADLDSDLPHAFVVDRARPADKKSYPVRWLVVAVSAVAGLTLALALIVIREHVRKLQASHA